jgi:hypothetical protein
VKFLENILFAFGCLSLPALVWWQPEIAGLQRKAGIPDSLGFPVRWILPFLTLAASGWLYCLTGVVHAGRASQGRIPAFAFLFGLAMILLSIPVMLSVLPTLLRFMH